MNWSDLFHDPGQSLVWSKTRSKYDVSFPLAMTRTKCPVSSSQDTNHHPLTNSSCTDKSDFGNTLRPSLLRHKYHSSRCVTTKVTLCYSCHVMSRLTVSRDRPRCSRWWRWRGPGPSRWRRRPGRGREALLEQTALTRCSWARWVGARGRGCRCSSGVWGPPGSRHWSVR